MSQLSKNKKNIGTLVPLSALTSINSKKEDQGTFETGMYFLDWLHKVGQNAWQILPLNLTQLETGSRTTRVPSPYKGYGVGLDPKYLPSAFANNNPAQDELNFFMETNNDWISDYALFCAISDDLGTDDWRKWDEGLRKRDQSALNKVRNSLKKKIKDHILIQWRLDSAYKALREKAKRLNIQLIGDLPFYVSVKSPLVWVHQDVFQFEKDSELRYVSGIPDTPAAHFGRQVWGHPLYKWDTKHEKDVIKFWEIRIKYLSQLFDSIRFDHAKGLFDYGVVDLQNKSEDRYVKGPGSLVFEKLMLFGERCGLSIFAEDSGENLSVLRETLVKLKTPGIKIFRFALNEKKKKLNKEYADLSNYPINTVVYTTTHDTESLILYLEMLSTEQKQQLAIYANAMYSPKDVKFALSLREAVINSNAKTVIIPIQDWLLTKDRINIPGTEKEINDPNWRFILKSPIEKLALRNF
ncbi:MAG TPA: 4-alpha-glucanotransferase [Candidatus Limnocylindrales bacterium]|nr:4-alpha-glucanotransferase [Candidatus Limnocylindrales bacterium]